MESLLPLHPTITNPGPDIKPLDCSSLVLDLSRKRPQSPDYPVKRMPSYLHSPTSTMCSPSPNSFSESDTSENSEQTRDFKNNGATIPKLKTTRPFKAYPKDPLVVAAGGLITSDTIIGQEYAESYTAFRQRLLSRMQHVNSGTNKNMRRNSQTLNNNHNEDPTYWEKRRKNNEAAKRSRDARRAKEDEIAIRCAFLEKENMQLKFHIANLESERERLQRLLYH